MRNSSRSCSSVRCIATFACAIVAVAFGVFSPSCAMAQDVEVMVIPLSDHADGDAAPDGSGFVLLASSAQPSRYGVVITSDSGVSSAEITVGQDGTFATISQEGNSGYDLDAPVALSRNGNIAFAVAVKPRGGQAAGAPSAPGAASGSWLDNYANWFNGTFGSGWSNTVGGVITSVAPINPNASDAALLTGTVIVSIPAGVAILAGGEVLLGVGTFGGATVATGGAGLTAAQIEINAAYAEITALRTQLAALEATQAQLQSQLLFGAPTAIEQAGFATYATARLVSVETAIAAVESRIAFLWTWIDLLL